ncbi:MAG: amidoligase family protein [Hymenobacteraceae bacterium]|nr:amidoligase family protein [Hymenobacteraceae bacterium]MDX5481023.1 amidoligase family protein [Hymenobacteraceae bacterium]
MQFKQLPVLHNERGELRTVGFELEFANVNIEESLQIIQKLYGGTVQKEHRFSQKVVGTSLGDFSVKIDLKLLNERTYRGPLEKLGVNLQDIRFGHHTLEDEVETALESLVNKVIPYEIVTPPLPCTQVEQFERLRKELFMNHAEGTKAFLTNAFATHINVEVPDTSAATVLRYLKAFLLLYPWLLKEGETDLARKVTSFINPYPARYTEMVLNPSYYPDLNTMIDDYHLYNPDRNRPLDLYPLFAELRQEKVAQFYDLGNVKARKTFHYRLPNSSISQPDWSLAKEWNNWVQIEELANNPDKLARMSQAYLLQRQDTLIGFESKWAKQTEQWLS